MINQPDLNATDPNFSQPKSLIDLSFTPLIEPAKPEGEIDIERDLVLTPREARAGSPADIAACGEEDPGSGLEFLVTRDDPIY